MVDAAANSALTALEACPCCLLGPQQRGLTTPYTHLGDTEIYADMLRECFGIQLDVASDTCGICQQCVVRLRDASHFKRQVQRSQAQLRERLARVLKFIEEEPADEDGTSDHLSASPARSEMNAHAQALNRSCSVSLHQMFVDTEHRTCRVGSQTYRLSLYSRNPRPILEAKGNDSRKSKRSNLKTAEMETVGEKKASVSGQVCSVTNEDVGEMPGVKHSKTANITKETPYKCNHCSYASAYKRVLVEHERKHTGEKPYKCNRCSYASAHKSHLVVHVRLHTGEKPYKCSHCSYACAVKSNLLDHETRKHTGEKPYKFCSYTNAQKSLSLVHEEHTGDKHYKCSHCSYASTQKCHLVVHLRRHTGDKPFKCSHCSYASTDKSNLLVHQRKHTGEKPYKCSHCSYASAYKSALLSHERNHTSEKPYKCSHCSYASISKSHSLRHERKHNGDTV